MAKRLGANSFIAPQQMVECTHTLARPHALSLQYIHTSIFPEVHSILFVCHNFLEVDDTRMIELSENLDFSHSSDWETLFLILKTDFLQCHQFVCNFKDFLLLYYNALLFWGIYIFMFQDIEIKTFKFWVRSFKVGANAIVVLFQELFFHFSELFCT